MTRQLDALHAAIALLRADFERFKRDVALGQILTDDELAYWKAHTRAVEALVTELRTYEGELPGKLKQAAQAVTDIPAPACRPDDHERMLRPA